ncbi:beta-ketoacyl synthase chain length factor [Dyella acidiphila]|uniref:Beta-ketoacyl synthase chain length factor n=1 Tax=Dyella acidiphila TaxID=2775866 RepID=A0ABR9G6D4_9GAMM|nr:beta-ketoacyl synthase chain length factor [Dyella acidiphila]MBE1159603.1 beta-ketoacyl synthase chain length factor [Dyella acidiphila]
MSALCVQVEGVGLWTPLSTHFEALRHVLAGEALPEAAARPPTETLSVNERRRAPESVMVAIEVASQAVNMSGHAASDLACVFASAYGDQATTDYMCRVLAHVPTELSPTRFHNSVHNASAGYWTIATDCHAPSSAVCAGTASFGAALLEAATQACTRQCAVLLVCSDTAGVGPLGELIGCQLAFGAALVLSPATDEAMPQLRLSWVAQAPRHAPLPPACTTWMRDNPSAASLPVLAMLAAGGGECVVAASERRGLLVQMERTT